jgi:hypothetical protein
MKINRSKKKEKKMETQQLNSKLKSPEQSSSGTIIQNHPKSSKITVNSRKFVDVKIPKPIKEFIISANGSDLIIPGPKSLLWQLVKQHLKVVPADYKPIIDRTDYIRIEILTTHSAKILATKQRGIGKGAQQNITLNTDYRTHLDARGQSAVAKQLRRTFKECFHNFVMGSIFDNPEKQQKIAIENFCTAYNIEFNEISYEMLVKSWNRSPQRAKIKGQNNTIPITI